MSNIIDDSSIYELMMNKDYAIRVGMVREHVYIPSTGETQYIVEVKKKNVIFPMSCIRSVKFGGLYNYEEFNQRGFKVGTNQSTIGDFRICPGDMVIVAAANGEAREGIILGSIKHPGRQEILPADGSISYISEFNGLQKIINSLGEYRVTFKGTPTNIDKLLNTPDGSEYPLPEHNDAISYSYYQFDKTGSYIVSDNASEDPQSISIDKPNGKIIITSGKTSLVIDKKSESYEITNKKVTFNTQDEFNINTKKTSIKSTDLFELQARDIKTKGKMAQEGDVSIKGNTDQVGNMTVTGDLTSTGKTSLAGGAHALVYDIILCQGAGNFGAPVFSNLTVLKTSQTKAT